MQHFHPTPQTRFQTDEYKSWEKNKMRHARFLTAISCIIAGATTAFTCNRTYLFDLRFSR
jgi:hypothetical protein